MKNFLKDESKSLYFSLFFSFSLFFIFYILFNISYLIFFFVMLLGKKFSTVDKNWRSSISAAKLNPKVLDYCDNEKLLER